MPEERKSYTILLDAAGFNSTEIYINLGLILWIPCTIIALMPLALLVDHCCSVSDKQTERFGGRRRLTTKPLVQMLVNLLTRFALIGMLDIMICVFVSLSSHEAGVYTGQHVHETINLCISWILVAMLISFVLFIIGYGIWRYYKAKNAKVWKDFDVSGYVCTLYEGVNIHHPENTTIYLLAFIARQVTYAATIVFMYEEPVFQLYVLLSTSILYNCVLAFSRPFVQTYNMALHYFNEFTFFFYICMCLTFTDFVEDVPTRQQTGSVLSTLMFFILSFNILIGLVALALTQRHLCEKRDQKSEISEKILNRRVIVDEIQSSDRKVLMNDQSARHDMSHDFILQRGDKTVLELDEQPKLLEPEVY